MTDESQERQCRLHASLTSIHHAGRLKLQFSLHRLFTYPKNFQENFSIEPQTLAETGLVFSSKNLRCCFCKFTKAIDAIGDWTNLSASEILENINTPDCPLNLGKTENVPIGNIDQAPNYNYEAIRLYSLLKKKDWKFVQEYDLANAGFYFTGQGDNCRCQFCHLEVRGWEEGDTPVNEHKRWNPECPLMKARSSVPNIEIGQEETSTSCDCIASSGHKSAYSITSNNPFKVSGTFSKYGIHLKLKTCNTFNVTSTNLNVMDWWKPKNSKFASLSNRLKSFKDWPISLEQKPAQLTSAGFFYTGHGDRVICFHCNLGLKDWAAEDEPADQHAKWNSGCQFLLISKGPDFLEKTLHSVSSDKAVLESCSKQKNSLNLTCRKCQKDHVAKVNLPCGHIQLCVNCEKEKCISCNAKIIAEINFFF